VKDVMALTAPPAGWYHQRLDRDDLRFWDGNRWTDERRSVPQPGWYPHPDGRNGLRYWNGSAWTSDVAPAAAARTPVTAPPVAPTPPPSPPPPPSTPVAPPWAAAPSEPLLPDPGATEGAAEAVARLRATPVSPPEGTAEAVAKFRAKPISPPDGAAEAAPSTEKAAPRKEREGRSRVLLAIEAIVLVAVVVVGGYLLVTKSGLSLGGSSAPPPVHAPAGYHLVSLSSARLEFAVPNAWLGVDPSSPAVQQDLQRVAAENPQLSGFAASTSNIKYLAVDASNPAYGSNVEVLNLGVTKAALSNAVAVQSAFRNEVPNATATTTTIAGTRGLSLTGTVPVTLSTGAHVTVHATAYIVGTSTGVFSLIYGTTDDASQDVNVQTALHTLRLIS
jgi:hypothetical protein